MTRPDPREARLNHLNAGLLAVCAGLAMSAGGANGQPAPAEPRSAVRAETDQAADQPAEQAADQAADQPAGRPGEAEAAAPAPEPMVSFSAFAEPITLSALIEFVAHELGVIIMQTEGAALAGSTVEFSAPIDIPRSELLPLLETLLAPQNFGIFRSPAGFYTVMPSARAPVDMSEGEFSPTRIIRTPLLTPTSIQNAITSAVGADGAKIVYLDELGLIISTAPPRINQAISAVVERMSREVRSQQMHRFDLTHIAAAEAKTRILELTGQASQSAAAVGQSVQGAPGAGATRAGGLGNLRDRLLIDRPTNALIYRGSAEEAEEVARFVAVVDMPTRLIVKRYFAGPTAAEICQVGARQGLGPIIQSGAGAGGAARAGGSEGLGAGFVLGGADAESFTYYGTQSQHEQVRSLVDEFADQAREETFVVEFYKLRNIAAEDTADLLTQLMEVDQQRTADLPFLPGSQRFGSQDRITRLSTPPTERPADDAAPAQADAVGAAGDESSLTPTEGVSVIADVPNNQLIIRAPRRQQREFARIINRLDQRRPQVYIEVQIVSVSRSTDFTLSVDTALTNPDSDVPIFTNFGLIPFGSVLPVPNSTRGATAAVIRNDYTPFVINALASQGDGEIISSPRLLVSDNEEANISSTRSEPFSSTSQVAGAPSVTSTGGNLTAGTILTIRPTISDGAGLRLEYSIELSSFGERPSPDLPPVTLADNFESIVTVPANSTVVVGGLTFFSRDKTVEKVPLLGDIPLLGLAFQSSSRMKSERTVYVFITPRVLRDEAFQDLRLLTRGPREATGIEDLTPDLLPAIMPVIDSGSGT